MKKITITLTCVGLYCMAMAQSPLTPEKLWSLGRVGAETLSPDGKSFIYGVTNYDIASGKGERNLYAVGLDGANVQQITNTVGGEGGVFALPNGKMGYFYQSQIWQADWNGANAIQLTNYADGLGNVRISPDGKKIAFSKDVKLQKVLASEQYKDLNGSSVRIYDDLNYRHWDTWEDGAYSHIFVADWNNGAITNEKDIMEGQLYDCPQMPFGGIEDFVWHNDSKFLVYVTKQKTGTEYTLSTNTDIFLYNTETGGTRNVTAGKMGYDTNPAFSPNGQRMAWLSMERDGYEADKNRLYIEDKELKISIDATSTYDETVEGFRWSLDGNFIYF